MTYVETLGTVRRLIDDPDSWTRGRMATDRGGERTDPFAPDAVAWCLTGAITRSTDEVKATVERLTRDLRLMTNNPFIDVTSFNDANDHDTVVGTLDRIIRHHEGSRP